MSKWIWCGALVFGLGAGAAALKCVCFPGRGPAPASVAVTPPEPRLVAPATPNLVAKLPTVVEYLNEPIVTRPELSADSATSALPLPTTGGAEESEAGVTQSPRPDREMRRMPYADEPEWVDRVFQGWPQVIWTELPEDFALPGEPSLWSAWTRWICPNDARDSVEESEEPPLLMLPAPAYDHPPHCPHGGHCPFPGSYRYVFPR